ncbi:YncE family protein [Clostridium sp. cel8]|uniref:YncE family protein n=1 Tax=Clostridium sp. cel8 TaxID=2663123 RepID=UPI0015F668C7|nr:YncE family protein [Clostridium sp. cel8]MBA5851219.1 YncE family protein [Clostridium sp. cel8]
MNSLYICSTSSDFVAKVDLIDFKLKNKIYLKARDFSYKIGPHGICNRNDKIITANNYANSISIIDIKTDTEEESYYIGAHCNDIVTLDNKAYIICSDSNSLIVFDLKYKKILEQIPCGNLPHSICLNLKRRILLVSNMQSNSVTLIDCDDTSNIKNIKVGSYPTKAIFTVDGEHIIVCESNLGSESRGSISVLSLKNYKIINRIVVGNSPLDIYCNSRYCFTSNFGDGTVSIVDINNYKECKNIIVGGMPAGILKYDRHLYIGDNYNNILIKFNIENNKKEFIPIGNEPTGMIIR